MRAENIGADLERARHIERAIKDALAKITRPRRETRIVDAPTVQVRGVATQSRDIEASLFHRPGDLEGSA